MLVFVIDLAPRGSVNVLLCENRGQVILGTGAAPAAAEHHPPHHPPHGGHPHPHPHDDDGGGEDEPMAEPDVGAGHRLGGGGGAGGAGHRLGKEKTLLNTRYLIALSAQ